MKPYKIILADDHILVRDALKQSLEEVGWIEVIGEVSGGLELMNFLTKSTPDLIVLDISTPQSLGLDAALKIKTQYPDIKILILTMHKSREYLRQALEAGVEGYLLKENALSDLITAIETVRRGEVYVSSLLSAKILRKQFGLTIGGGPLSPRETEVLKLVAGGKSSKEIGDLLSISIMTVFNHRVHIKKKLNIKRNSELIRFALENGYV